DVRRSTVPCVDVSPRLRARGITCDPPGRPYPSCACWFQRRETAFHKLQDDGERPHEGDSKFRLQARERLSGRLNTFVHWFPQAAGSGGAWVWANDNAVSRDSRTSIVDEMREEHRRVVLGE